MYAIAFEKWSIDLGVCNLCRINLDFSRGFTSG